MSLDRRTSFEPSETPTEQSNELRRAAQSDVNECGLPEATSRLISDVAAVIRQFIVLTDSQAGALALWVLHTHVMAAADYTPYLAITSAEKQSGKSRLLDLLTLLVKNGWYTGHVSTGALVRQLHRNEVTLLLDEVDAALGGGQEYTETLRGILNAGFKRGGVYSMCVVTSGGDWGQRDFNVFGAKAFGLIGELPETVADRSILIRMRRKLPTDEVERMTSRRAAEVAGPLQPRLLEWAKVAVPALSGKNPGLPEQLSDRAADVWEPLFAIADLAGDDSAAAARAASVALAEHQTEESTGVRPLSDIRNVFGSERMSSQELVRLLIALEESPWGMWSRAWGASLTPQALARLLRPYEIGPQAIRFGSEQKKGYHRASFEDAWARYLPQNGLNRVNDINTPSLDVDRVDGVDGGGESEPDLF